MLVRQFTKSLEIVWNDDHVSTYSLKWLEDRSFAESDRQHYLNTVYRPEPKLWSKSDFNQIIENFQYDDVVNTSTGMP